MVLTSANPLKKPGLQSVPLDHADSNALESSGASQNRPMNAQRDTASRRPATPKIPPDLPKLSSTTKNILARVQGAKSTPTGSGPPKGFHHEYNRIPGLLPPSIPSGNVAGAFPKPSNNQVLPSNFSAIHTTSTSTNRDNFSDGGSSIESDRYRGTLNHPAKAQTSSDQQLDSRESTINVGGADHSQASLMSAPVSNSATSSSLPPPPSSSSSSSRQQRSYVLADGTVVKSGKGLGRGRPGIKRGPRKPKLDPKPATTLVVNKTILSPGPSKKRKRPNLAGDEERVKTRISVSDDDDDDEDEDEDEDEDNYTPKTSHTRSSRSTQKPSAFVPSDTSAQKKPRPAAGPTNAEDKNLIIKKKVYRGREQNALCERCLRGRGPVDNAIVFCDGCNLCWHQKCHDPRIPKELVLDTKAEWFCEDCAVKLQLTARGAEDTTVQQSGKSVQRAGPDTIAPGASTHTEPAPLSNTTGEHAVTITSAPLTSASSLPINQRKQYLHSLSRQQLLDLLLHVSNIAPNLPIFPALAPSSGNGITSNPTPNRSPRPEPTPVRTMTPQTPTKIGPTRSEITTVTNMRPPPPPLPPLATSPNPNLNPFRAAKAAAPKYTSPSSPSSDSADDSSEEEEYDEEEEDDYAPSHSKCYPEAGQGVMAMLPPDSADEHMLLEGPEIKTFSHSLKVKGTGVFGMVKWLSEDARGLVDENKENWLHSASRASAR